MIEIRRLNALEKTAALLSSAEDQLNSVDALFGLEVDDGDLDRIDKVYSLIQEARGILEGKEERDAKDSTT